MRVRSFTDSAPVRLVVAASPYLFSASDVGLDRWDVQTGERVSITKNEGLPGDVVEAMAYDEGRRLLWISTDGGLSSYDLASQTFRPIDAAPSVLGVNTPGKRVMAPSLDGGLWIGHPSGLYYTNPAGQWTATGITESVTGVAHDRSGHLWIGTSKGLLGKSPDGKTLHFGADEGCDLVIVEFVGLGSEGPVAVGQDTTGAQRICVRNGEAWGMFRASPDERWLTATTAEDRIVVLTERRVVVLRAPSSGARSLSRDGMRLLPMLAPAGQRAVSPYALSTIDVALPPGAISATAVKGEVFVATRDLGISRLGARGKASWLRRSDLSRGAQTMSVACQKANDCYVATGARPAWRFDGNRFVPVGEADVTVLAFVRSPEGTVFALHREEDGGDIGISRVVDGTLLAAGLTIETPGTLPELTFSRFSPSGVLWLGLRYRDETNEVRPFGVALVDISLGAVAYHHQSRDQKAVAQGILPIPVGVVDAGFLEEEEVWLATTEGAARVKGEEVSVFNEEHGLRSEMLRSIACSSGGIVFVASGAGVGFYDGEQWRYPRALSWPVEDLEIGEDGKLWMATERGVALYDGARVRRLDVRRGLLDNRVANVAIDQFGRVWARSAPGLTVIEP